MDPDVAEYENRSIKEYNQCNSAMEGNMVSRASNMGEVRNPQSKRAPCLQSAGIEHNNPVISKDSSF